MDRLSALIIVAALAACEGKKEEALPGRVNTTKVAQKNVSTEAFCDVQFTGDKGPKLTIPPLAGGTIAASAPGWRWLNIWATWCKPCVEEMPRLAKWREQLGAKGVQYELAFVSVDEDEKDLVDHRKDHPELPQSPRLADPTKQGDWFQALGLDGGAPVPIHVFVAPSGHIRCARAGGVREQDFAAVEKVFSL